VSKTKDKKFLVSIAFRVKYLRSLKRVTQEDFLNDTGIHIGRIETAKRDFSMTTLRKICDYFNVTPEEFFSEGFEAFFSLEKDSSE
jgi:transcriptional regulator with XRE-family HTH domain